MEVALFEKVLKSSIGRVRQRSQKQERGRLEIQLEKER